MDNFSKEIDGKEYKFRQVFYESTSKWSITFTDENNLPITFHISKDEQELWRIEAQALPDYVFDNLMNFSDAIEYPEELNM